MYLADGKEQRVKAQEKKGGEVQKAGDDRERWGGGGGRQ